VLAGAYLEAASVCLSRHRSPPINFDVSHENDSREFVVVWEVPGQRILRAWANADDATRDGAYGVVIAAIEAMMGFFAVQRAETRTGADYYVGTNLDALDIEDAWRLEVSGVDHGSASAVAARVNQKTDQARQGYSNLPAMVGVAGFLVRSVVLRRVVV